MYCAACIPLQAAVIGIANIYYGILYMWVLGVWAWASYTAVLAAIVAVSLTKDTSSWMRYVHSCTVLIEFVGASSSHWLHAQLADLHVVAVTCVAARLQVTSSEQGTQRLHLAAVRPMVH